MPQTFADRAREVMALRGMGTNELNRAMGKPMGFASNLLTRTNPRMDTLSALAVALGVRLQWLASGEGPRDATPLENEIEGLVGHLRGKPVRATCFGDLPGWAELEQALRGRGKYSHFTDDDWASARGTMGGKLPEHLDEVTVIRLVEMWHGIHQDEKDGKFAAEDADRKRRLAEAQERNREKKKLAVGAEGQASPPPPPVTSKPKSGPKAKQ